MAPPPAHSSYPMRLSPLEGLMPNTYVRQIYCFPTSNPSSAVNVLSRGLRGLAQDVPYILSRLVSTTSASGIAVSAPCRNPEDLLSRHDLSDSISYAALQSAYFPPGAFTTAPGNGIAPPESLAPYPASPAVFAARATLVAGGLVLCVAVHHAMTDITGYGALLKIWASHCRTSSSSSEDIGFDANWMNRAPLFSASTSSISVPLPDLLHVRTPEEEAARSARRSRYVPEDFQTGIFYFPHTRLRALKGAVNAHIASRGAGADAWVSTGDVLTSLLWSAIIAATADGAEGDVVPDDATRTSTLSFPVQFRSVLRPPLPRDFLGAAFVMTNAKVLHKDVCLVSPPRANSNFVAARQQLKTESRAEAESPVDFVDIGALANVALAIRRSTQGIDDAAVRQVLECLEAHREVNPKAPLILGPPRYDAGGSWTSVVSWADQCIYELDWGDDIGRCDAVRLSKMESERDPIILPRVPGLDGDDGGLEVIMSYERTRMQRLADSPIMRQLAVLRYLS
ncbi:hypothetical protein F5Y14DRAFT_399710 [Nemania sp. NC0429]|nr:hypothetical protein F5Y14DRAFT_399710 [Nemania sp. NC0429]